MSVNAVEYINPYDGNIRYEFRYLHPQEQDDLRIAPCIFATFIATERYSSDKKNITGVKENVNSG